MTRLLVSVRNATEARAALAGGADVIDIKEPSRGALGPADPAEWRAVLAAVAGRAPVSVALGELLSDPVEDLARHATGMAFAKTGLAGCGTVEHWQTRWRRALEQLPRDTQSVAVVYADWRLANAPSPECVVAAAAANDGRLLLIDTWSKSGGSLFDCLAPSELEELVASAREAGLQLALAGSLTAALVPRALGYSPDYVAVRGAACWGGREGSVDEQLVAALSSVVRGAPQFPFALRPCPALDTLR